MDGPNTHGARWSVHDAAPPRVVPSDVSRLRLGSAPAFAPAGATPPGEPAALDIADVEPIDLGAIAARPSSALSSSLRAVLGFIAIISLCNAGSATASLIALGRSADERAGGETAGLVLAYLAFACISVADALRVHADVTGAAHEEDGATVLAARSRPGTGVTGYLMHWVAAAAGVTPYVAGLTGRLESFLNPLAALGLFVTVFVTGNDDGDGSAWYHVGHLVGQLVVATPRLCLGANEGSDHVQRQRVEPRPPARAAAAGERRAELERSRSTPPLGTPLRASALEPERSATASEQEPINDGHERRSPSRSATPEPRSDPDDPD